MRTLSTMFFCDIFICTQALFSPHLSLFTMATKFKFMLYSLEVILEQGSVLPNMDSCFIGQSGFEKPQ